ncbi:MAG: hypothetical protein ACI80V_002601 [Rhodothermales bacterium]|jgi:hypothetical protein
MEAKRSEEFETEGFAAPVEADLSRGAGGWSNKDVRARKPNHPPDDPNLLYGHV